MIEYQKAKHRKKPKCMSDAEIVSDNRFVEAEHNDELKDMTLIEHSRLCSLNEFITNPLAAIAAYFFKKGTRH